MKLKKFAGSSWKLLKQTYFEFEKDNAIKLSASLSYHTIFSLPPLLIILLSIFSFFLRRDAVTGRFFGQINDWLAMKLRSKFKKQLKALSYRIAIRLQQYLAELCY